VTGAPRRVKSGTPGGGVRAADHSRRFLDVIVTERRWIQAREDQERGRCLRSEIAIKRQATRVFTITCLSSELSIQLRANVPCLCARNLLPSAEGSWAEKTVTKQRSHIDLPTFGFWFWSCTAAYRIPPPHLSTRQHSITISLR
jgi:hypothetical protein